MPTVTHAPRMIAFKCRSTGYYPTPDNFSSAENRLQGGPLDRRGKPLCTLQEYLDGDAAYVSVAMDLEAFRYGTKLCIPVLELHFKRIVEFRVVDTGEAFRGRGLTRIDICCKDRAAAYEEVVNQTGLLCVALLDRIDS